MGRCCAPERDSAKLAIHLVVHSLQPLVGAAISGHLQGQMGEPAVRSCAVPMLYLGRDVDHIPGMQLPGFLAPLLIPAPTGHADQDLAAALPGVVNVLVVAAARLEGHVVHPYLLGG